MDPQREPLGAPRVPKWNFKGSQMGYQGGPMEPKGSHMDPKESLMEPKGSHMRPKVAPRVATDTPKTKQK